MLLLMMLGLALSRHQVSLRPGILLLVSLILLLGAVLDLADIYFDFGGGNEMNIRLGPLLCCSKSKHVECRSCSSAWYRACPEAALPSSLSLLRLFFPSESRFFFFSFPPPPPSPGFFWRSIFSLSVTRVARTPHIADAHTHARGGVKTLMHHLFLCSLDRLRLAVPLQPLLSHVQTPSVVNQRERSYDNLKKFLQSDKVLLLLRFPSRCRRKCIDREDCSGGAA